MRSAVLIRLVLAHRQLLDEEHVDQLERAGFAAFELAHRMVEHFQGTRHSEGDQSAPDALEDRQAFARRNHGRPPSPASRRATAS